MKSLNSDWLQERVKAASKALNSSSIIRQKLARKAVLSNSSQGIVRNIDGRQR